MNETDPLIPDNRTGHDSNGPVQRAELMRVRAN